MDQTRTPQASPEPPLLSAPLASTLRTDIAREFRQHPVATTVVIAAFVLQVAAFCLERLTLAQSIRIASYLLGVLCAGAIVGALHVKTRQAALNRIAPSEATLMLSVMIPVIMTMEAAVINARFGLYAIPFIGAAVWTAFCASILWIVYIHLTPRLRPDEPPQPPTAAA